MKVAFYTYSYIDRLQMEPAEVIPAVAAAGYRALDLSATWRADEDPAHFPAARRREIRRLADDHGLSIEALVTHLPMTNALRAGRPINLPGAVDLARELAAPVVTVHVGTPEAPLPGRVGREAAPEDWALAVEYLQTCCDYARERGVTLALDALFPDFLTPTPQTILELIQDVGSSALGHNFDPCYLALCGFSIPEAAQLLGPHLVHVHLKDHIGLYPHWEHRIPGAGVLNHAEWATALGRVGFQGSVAVECFTDMPLQQALHVGFQTVSQLPVFGLQSPASTGN